MTDNYYVYAYLREDGTPYYIGKGKGKRITAKHRLSVPTDEARRVKLVENLTEEEAHNVEMKAIAHYGRIDNGTGILRNLTDGGEGTSGWNPSEETKAKIGSALRALGENHQSKRPEQRLRVSIRSLGDNNHMRLPEWREWARAKMEIQGNPSQTPEFSKSQSEFQFSLGASHNFRKESHRVSQREKMTGDGNIAKRPDVREKLSANNAMNNEASRNKIRDAALQRERKQCPGCGRMLTPHGMIGHTRACKLFQTLQDTTNTPQDTKWI